MSTFNRKFDLAPETALYAPENAWFRDLLKFWRPAGTGDPRPATREPASHLRVAIRDGHLNFYRAGQSVARVGVSGRRLYGEVHNKYVYGDNGGGHHYVRIADGIFKDHDGARVQYRENLVRDWILEANRYADDEKRFVDEMIARQPGAIDLEAALPACPEPETSAGAPRLDLVTLEPFAGHYQVVFWEVKLVTNQDARCKSPDTAPQVLHQLKRYRDWLAANRQVVCTAYENCCRALVQLHAIARELRPDLPELGSSILTVAQGAAPLTLDEAPRLIVDATRGDSSFTQNGHLRKLRELGISVQMVHSPADMAMHAGALTADR